MKRDKLSHLLKNKLLPIMRNSGHSFDTRSTLFRATQDAIVFQKNILDLVGVGLAPTPAGRPQGHAPTLNHYLNIYSSGN